MRAREELLGAQIAKAEEMKAEAEKKKSELAGRLARIEETKESLLAEAKQEAALQYDQLMERYRREAAEKRAELARQLEREQELLLREVRLTMGESAVQLATGILGSLAGEDLERSVFAQFVERVGQIGPDDLDRTRVASEDKATLMSHAALSSAQRGELEERLQSSLGFLPGITYEVDEDLVLGYELSFSTLLVQKNLSRYLDEVSRRLREELGRKL